MKLKFKPIIMSVLLCVFIVGINPQKVEAKSLWSALTDYQTKQQEGLEKLKQKSVNKLDRLEAEKEAKANDGKPEFFITKWGRDINIAIAKHEIKQVQKGIDGQPAVSNPVGNALADIPKKITNSRLKNDLENVVTGAELSGAMKNQYIAALGGLPKFQDINIPTSLNLISKNPPKTPSVAKYSYRLPAPSIDKASLQDKFISGLNTEDEMMKTAVDKFKLMHGIGK